MGPGGGYVPGNCRISMLWNWYTIDSCFIARGWHNRTKAGFAGSCIAVVALCVFLEFLRRGQREYDRLVMGNMAERKKAAATADPDAAAAAAAAAAAVAPKDGEVVVVNANQHPPVARAKAIQPNVTEQLIRTAFYVLQFAVAYLIMLLAMYYNGYVIICILIGVFLGHFIFGFDNVILG
ncbi:Ctr copper transporter [Ascobolus immersus RN42]|uniref:Copper transport protein n=1 Tax=Ascobolus immersus RN42 TaxID=1160509 RepID=A0A3N4HY36_ASCIM|nr:Ctr copper transporter [Ascobolus immersus RN42]